MADKVKEDYLIIGFDNAGNDDIAVLSVATIKANGTREISNVFRGEEALWMYNRLLSKEPIKKD